MKKLVAVSMASLALSAGSCSPNDVHPDMFFASTPVSVTVSEVEVVKDYKPPRDIGRPRRTGPSGGRIIPDTLEG